MLDLVLAKFSYYPYHYQQLCNSVNYVTGFTSQIKCKVFTSLSFILWSLLH